jgi:hypothetical protein
MNRPQVHFYIRELRIEKKNKKDKGVNLKKIKRGQNSEPPPIFLLITN